MIKDITTYLKNCLGTGWTIGTNIFCGYAPVTADETACLIVIETGGMPSFYTPDYVEKTVQVLARAKTYQTAYTYAVAAYNALHGKAGITLPKIGSKEYYANTISAVAYPQSVGQDVKGNFVFSTNFVFKVQDK